MFELFFGGFALFWMFIWLMMLLSLLFTAFNVWMMIDAIRRFTADTGKMILFILLIWLIPFGGLIYYFAAVPVKDRFFKRTLISHRGKVTAGIIVLVIIFLLGSVVIVAVASKAGQSWDAKKRQVEEAIEESQREQQKTRKEGEELREKNQELIEEFETRRDEFQRRNDVKQTCAKNFYFGPNCEGEPPQEVKDAAEEELGVTDEDEIQDLCGCTPASSPARF